MGVPITFLDKYNPEQFEILGITDRGNEYGIKTKEYTQDETPLYGDLNRRGAIWVDGQLKSTYARILIRRRHQPVPYAVDEETPMPMAAETDNN